MKNLKISLVLVLSFFLLSSCTRDDNSSESGNEKVSLVFNANLQNLNRRSLDKQQVPIEFPVCGQDDPAYVGIVMMAETGDTPVLGDPSAPFMVDLVEGTTFTREVPELQMEPGTYYLDHFSVYNSFGDLIWLAPKGGQMANLVNDPLPMACVLSGGTKPYMDVPVICYDQRDVNEYGYLFFELEANQAVDFCFFANYCDANGRHFPARYSLEVSINGETIASKETNSTGVNEDGDAFAEPLCVTLPLLAEFDPDEEYLDYTLTLLPWEGVYEAEEMIIRGSLSKEDIRGHYDGDQNIEYEHIRFNCGQGEAPADLPDIEDSSFPDPTNLDNPFYGPPAGETYIYEAYAVEEGEVQEEVEEEITIERRSSTKEIMGITAAIQHDVVSVNGVVVEDTDDWLAQDAEGNIWYLGEDSRAYDEMGNFIGDEGSWEAGVDGALPGYWLPSEPFVGQIYHQEYYEGEAEDYAEVVSLDETLTIGLGTYDNVLVTKDINPFEPEVYELKYYAPGIGLIKEEVYEEEELVEVVVLVEIIS